MIDLKNSHLYLRPTNPTALTAIKLVVASFPDDQELAACLEEIT